MDRLVERNHGRGVLEISAVRLWCMLLFWAETVSSAPSCSKPRPRGGLPCAQLMPNLGTDRSAPYSEPRREFTMPRTNCPDQAQDPSTAPTPPSCHAPAPGTASPARDPIPGHKWTEVPAPAILPAPELPRLPRAGGGAARPVPAAVLSPGPGGRSSRPSGQTCRRLHIGGSAATPGQQDDDPTASWPGRRTMSSSAISTP